MDLHGILGADPDVRNGFSDITCNYDIDADARRRRSRPSSPSRRSARRSSTCSPTRPTSPSRSTEPRRAARRRATHVRRRHRRRATAGLAMSRCLAERSIDHVVLERGEVANSWRTERWDSLRLLTPNWHDPAARPRATQGADPDGYMTRAGGRRLHRGLRRRDRRPGADRHDVTRGARRRRRGYAVDTDRRRLVAPTPSWWRPGRATSPAVPAAAAELPPAVALAHAARVPQPGPAPRGRRAGRRRLGERRPDRRRAACARAARSRIAVGEHVRAAAPLPRRGHPLVDGRGRRPRRAATTRSTTWSARAASRRCSSSGRRRPTLDLNALTGAGRPAGRPARRRSATGRPCSPGRCRTCCALADLKLGRLLDTHRRLGAPSRPRRRGAARALRPTAVPTRPAARAATSAAAGSGPSSGPPATGPSSSWLELPVLNPRGRLRPRRRRHPVPRPLPHGDAVPAPPQVDAHRRRRRGRRAS